MDWGRCETVPKLPGHVAMPISSLTERASDSASNVTGD
jgi:hypothetical protein